MPSKVCALGFAFECLRFGNDVRLSFVLLLGGICGRRMTRLLPNGVLTAQCRWMFRLMEIVSFEVRARLLPDVNMYCRLLIRVVVVFERLRLCGGDFTCSR
ncbi:hypothetical protein Tco_0521826 [Tanacetum coccineum]